MLSEFFENYASYEQMLARIQLVLFMLGMGATLLVADFYLVFRQPRSLFIGFFIQLLLVPLLAVMINYMADLPPGVAVGMIMVAAMPGGTLSKVFSYLGRGNVALSITMTVCTTLGAIVTIPILLKLLAQGFVPMGFYMPTDAIMHELGLYLLLPLGMGMVIARFAPTHRRLFSKLCVRVGLVAVLAMIVGSLGSGAIHPAQYGWRTPLAIIFFCLLAQQLSMLPFRFFPWPRADRLSVGIEVTMRNMNLALLLKAEHFHDSLSEGVLFVILFYAAVALCAGFLLTLNHRRMARKEVRAGETRAADVNQQESWIFSESSLVKPSEDMVPSRRPPDPPVG